MKKIRKNLVLLCYSIFIVVSVGLCMFTALTDWVGAAVYRLGSVRQPLSECELVDLTLQPDGVLRVTGNDPQIVLPPFSMRVREVQLHMRASSPPGEVELYLLASPESVADVRHRVWARAERGVYVFTLPAGQVNTVRIDPASIEGVTLEISEMVLSPKQALWRYFLPSWSWMLACVVLPGLAASIIDGALAFWRVVRARKKQERSETNE